MKKILRKSIYLGIIILCLAFIVSCEEDFTDIGSNVISNTKFDVSAEEIEITINNSPLEYVQSDNISRQLGQYLLGVYNSPDYEKLEASIVSQVGVVTGLKVVDRTYGSDTTVVTKIDTAFIKLPYQVTLNSTGDAYELDSVFGDVSKSFNVNVYRSNTFINRFNPSDPTKVNSYNSNDTFDKVGNSLTSISDYQLRPDVNQDTVFVRRKLANNTLAKTDTITYTTNANQVAIPAGIIPLDINRVKELFLDKYESTEFSSQDELNNYLRGLIIEATGSESSLISLSFSNTNSTLRPSIEIYYTNTLVRTGTTTVLDTIYKFNSFPLSGFRINTFKMDEKTYPINNEVKIQGTAGNEGEVNILTQTKINELRTKQWLINDASVSLYINQSADISNIPPRLYMYKIYNSGTSSEIKSQIKDAISEAASGGIEGQLILDENGDPERYTFKITDYFSDLMSGEIDEIPKFRVKVFNPTDNPQTVSDTIFNNFSWNAKAVTLFSNLSSTKKPVLKISYSEKK